MLTSLPLHTPLIASLYKNRSLILQFLLDEFFLAGIEMESLGVLESDLKSIKELKAIFINLTGPIQELLGCLAWNHEQGILLKLKLYSGAFLASSEHRLNKYIQIEKFSTVLWKTGLDIIYLLNQIDQKKRINFNKDVLSKKIHTFTSTFTRLSMTLTDCIKHYPTDENLIFFLLRNKFKFEKIYGVGYLKKLLLEMHPEGIKQSMLIFRNKFIKRGFETIADQFATKFLELDLI